jgi:hypothetical protein
LLSKKRSKKELPKGPPFLVRVKSLVCTEGRAAPAPVGMGSRASGVARPRKGAKVRKVEASKKEPQPRKRQERVSERQKEAWRRAAPDARERIPTIAGGAVRSDHFFGAS